MTTTVSPLTQTDVDLYRSKQHDLRLRPTKYWDIPDEERDDYYPDGSRNDDGTDSFTYVDQCLGALTDRIVLLENTLDRVLDKLVPKDITHQIDGESNK